MKREDILGKKKPRNTETLIKGMHKAWKSKFEEAGSYCQRHIAQKL